MPTETSDLSGGHGAKIGLTRPQDFQPNQVIDHLMHQDRDVQAMQLLGVNR